MNMSKRGVILVILILIIVVAVGIYFAFFYTSKCGDKGCFDSSLTNCQRVSFLKDAADGTWYYKTKGKNGDSCVVYVKLLNLKEGNVDLLKLKDKDMLCYLPLGGVSGDPEYNLALCHGLLKEEMQAVIINRLHNYIVNNLGEIGGELGEVV